MKIWILSILASSTCLAQQSDQPKLNAEAVGNRLGDLTGPRAIRDFDFRYQGVIGSEFLVDEWVEGKVYFNDGKLAKNQGKYKYNAYTKDLYLKRSSLDSIIVNKDEIKEFQLKIGKDDEFVPFVKPKTLDIEAEKLDNTFLRVIYDGPTSFVKNHNKVFKKADYKGLYSQDKRYDSFNDSSEHFIVKNGKAIKVKLKGSSILDALQDHEPEVKAFMKANGFTAQTEGEVAKILEFYDSLK
jgi:hypothetical protein